MSLGITAADFLDILADQGVSLTYKAATRVIDPIYGSETITYAADATKTWVFFNRLSNIDLKAWGIVDIGDAYLMVPTTVTISYGDRVTFDSETYEFTPDCKEVSRYGGGIHLFNYYTLKKVA